MVIQKNTPSVMLLILYSDSLIMKKFQFLSSLKIPGPIRNSTNFILMYI